MDNFIITPQNQVRFTDKSGNLGGVIAKDAVDCIYDHHTSKFIVTQLDGKVRYFDKNGNPGGPIIADNAMSARIQDSNILLIRLKNGTTVKRDRNGNSR